MSARIYLERAGVGFQSDQVTPESTENQYQLIKKVESGVAPD